MDVKSIYLNRFAPDELVAMRQVWAVLTRGFFQRFIDPAGTVLDLGAGYCHFINAVKPRRKIAMDANPRISSFSDPDVEVVVSDDLNLPMFQDGELT